MNETTNRLVLLAVKHSVVAFDRETGERRWTRDLGGGLTGGEFVTLAADSERVYAHAHGRFFCLDLATGAILWQDELHGLGYGLASIAVPGAGSSSAVAAAQFKQDEATAASAAASTAT